MKISARNQLKGVVKEISVGAVNCEVILELSGGTVITAVITKRSVENLGLKVGSSAYAIVKASNVMVGVD
jgi:molybdate transport system regulatory protein